MTSNHRHLAPPYLRPSFSLGTILTFRLTAIARPQGPPTGDRSGSDFSKPGVPVGKPFRRTTCNMATQEFKKFPMRGEAGRARLG